MTAINGLGALSIRQPWAWYILQAGKDIENRGWRTRYRGRVLIHQAQKVDVDAMIDASVALDWRTGIPRHLAIPPCGFRAICDGRRRARARAGLIGGIVGMADLVDVVEASESPWFQGPFGFVLENPVDFRTVLPCRGMPGIFEPDLSPRDWDVVRDEIELADEVPF